MTYTAMLWRAETRALVALFIVVLILSIGMVVHALFGSAGVLTPMDSARRDIVRVLVVGAFFTVLYGAPLYALALWKKFAAWYVVFAIGVAPGVVLLFLSPHESLLVLWIAGSGLAVAFLTHLSLRSNPTVERDAPQAARPSP